MKEQKKVKKILKEVIKWGITLLAIAYVFSKVDPKEFWLQVRRADILCLIAALICFIISKVFSSFRLNIYFRNIGVLLTEWQNLRLYWLGMFYNLFLPGGIGGDGYKVWLLNKKKNVGIKKLTFAVFIDRINGMLAILILLLLFVYFLPVPQWMRYVAPLCLIAGYLLYVLIIRKFWRFFAVSIHITTLYSLGVQLIQCLSIFFIMQAIGLHENYVAWMFVFMVSSIVAVIPFTIGGLGAREVVFLYCSQWLQIDGAVAVSISLLFYVITVLTSFFGIYYNLFPQRLKISK